jgi:predicted transcriptional regulator
VSRQEAGRAHRYFPAIERQAARESALQRLTRRLFNGSPELLLTHLVSHKRLSPAQIRRLREMLDGQLPEKR